MPAAPLAAAALAGFALALAATLLFATAIAWTWRWLAVAVLAWLVIPPVAELGGARGRSLLGRDPAGRWWLRRGAGRRRYVQLRGRALMLGPWIWLQFREGSRAHYLLVDGRRAEPEAVRLLKVSLRLDPEGPAGLENDRDRPTC